MFVSLKKILPSTLKTNKIHNQINNIDSCIKIEEIIKIFLKELLGLSIVEGGLVGANGCGRGVFCVWVAIWT